MAEFGAEVSSLVDDCLSVLFPRIKLKAYEFIMQKELINTKTRFLETHELAKG